MRANARILEIEMEGAMPNHKEIGTALSRSKSGLFCLIILGYSYRWRNKAIGAICYPYIMQELRHSGILCFRLFLL